MSKPVRIRIQCSATIGRPGNIHGCKRIARFAVPVKSGYILYFCRDHVESHGGDTSGKYHSGATGEPREISGYWTPMYGGG